MGSSTAKISLKLLVDDKSKKVLFAEAGKDFIDFLFGIMEIPVGTIVGLFMELDHQSPIVSVYKSVINLDPTYLQTKHQDKNSLLKPKPASASSSSAIVTPLLLANLVSQRQNTVTPPEYEYDYDGNYRNHPREVGYVKEVVTYMVMDDMEVKPMSSISSITLINTFNVKDVSSLKEQNVVVDEEKARELLKALFKSNTNTVLTDVFLGKMKTTQTFSCDGFSQGIPGRRLGLILQGTVGRQRRGPLPRKFSASTMAQTRDHVLKRPDEQLERQAPS